MIGAGIGKGCRALFLEVGSYCFFKQGAQII
jgi:hypothetical protein